MAGALIPDQAGTGNLPDKGDGRRYCPFRGKRPRRSCPRSARRVNQPETVTAVRRRKNFQLHDALLHPRVGSDNQRNPAVRLSPSAATGSPPYKKPRTGAFGVPGPLHPGSRVEHGVSVPVPCGTPTCAIPVRTAPRTKQEAPVPAFRPYPDARPSSAPVRPCPLCLSRVHRGSTRSRPSRPASNRQFPSRLPSLMPPTARACSPFSHPARRYVPPRGAAPRPASHGKAQGPPGRAQRQDPEGRDVETGCGHHPPGRCGTAGLSFPPAPWECPLTSQIGWGMRHRSRLAQQRESSPKVQRPPRL